MMSLPSVLEDGFGSKQRTTASGFKSTFLQTEASPVTPSQGIESYETSLLGDPPEADSSLNRAESPTLSIDAVAARGEQHTWATCITC
ncbi:hypothetical protein QL093DRAFT_2558760 [Fusarium oxysporum]|nr:hypothetical protein QL093DRAFT_2558760 [Fusarium oxysporum]